MMATIRKYNGDQSTLVQQVDHVQTTLECCGGQNFRDYLAPRAVWFETHNDSIPWSCCCSGNESVYRCTNADPVPVTEWTHIFVEGCFDQLYNLHENNQGNILVALIFTLVLFVVYSCLFCCCLRRDREDYFDQNSASDAMLSLLRTDPK